MADKKKMAEMDMLIKSAKNLVLQIKRLIQQ